MTLARYTELGAQPAADGFVLRFGSSARIGPDASIVIEADLIRFRELGAAGSG